MNVLSFTAPNRRQSSARFLASSKPCPARDSPEERPGHSTRKRTLSQGNTPARGHSGGFEQLFDVSQPIRAFTGQFAGRGNDLADRVEYFRAFIDIGGQHRRNRS